MSGYENHLANQEERINRKHQLESEIDECKESILEAARTLLDVPIEIMNNLNVIISLGEHLKRAEAEHATL